MPINTTLRYLLEAGFISGGVKLVWEFYMQWRATKSAKKALSATTQIDQILAELVNETPADYAQIIHVHNGGEKLKPGTKQYTSCRFEKCTKSKVPIIGLLQQIEVGPKYAQLIELLITEGDGSRAVENVDSEFLQEIYAISGARFTRSTLLAVRKDGVFYLRCLASRQAMNLSSDQLYYRQAVNKLKKALV